MSATRHYLMSDRGRYSERQRLIEIMQKLPEGWRVAISEPKRSTEQNKKLHAMLTELSRIAVLNGQAYDVEAWKRIFVHALYGEHKAGAMRLLPSLDGKSYFAEGYRTSRLSVQECRDLIELIYVWCSENGIVLTEPDQRMETNERTDTDSI